MAADLKTYRNMLRVNKHRLDDEFEVHAQVMDDICEMLTKAEGREEHTKNELKLIEARLFQEFKDGADTKVTDKEADAQVMRSRERKNAWEAAQTAATERKEWDRLLQTWKAKETALRGLAGLFTSQYFVLTAHQVRERGDRHRSGEQARQERPAYTGGISRNRSEPEPEQPVRVRRRIE